MKRITLIELVIVAGIILFFFAMMMPALSKSKAKAQLSNCCGNMKQIGNAGDLYAGENKGVRPGPQPLGIGISEISWDRPLAIQMGANLDPAGVYEPLLKLTRTPAHFAAKTLATFSCPADPQQEGARSIPVVPGSLADGTAAGTGICRSYTMNLGSGNLVAGTDDGIATTADAVPVSKVVLASGTVYLLENHGYSTAFGQRSIANDTYLTCDKAGTVTPKDALTNLLMPRHDSKVKPSSKKKRWINTLMYDYHVERLDEAFFTADKGKIMQYIK